MSIRSAMLFSFVVTLSLDCSNSLSEDSAPQVSLEQVLEQGERIRQLHSACGPLSLARTLMLLGRPVLYDDLNAKFLTKSNKGVQIAELVTVSQAFVPGAKAIHLNPARLNLVSKPAIIAVSEGHHCVVLEEIDEAKDSATVWEPATLSLKSIPIQKLETAWNGDAIIFHPLPQPKWLGWTLWGLTLLNVSFLLVTLTGISRRSKRVPIHSFQEVEVR